MVPFQPGLPYSPINYTIDFLLPCRLQQGTVPLKKGIGKFEADPIMGIFIHLNTNSLETSSQHYYYGW